MISAIVVLVIVYICVGFLNSFMLFSHYAANYLGFMGGSLGFFFEQFLFYLPYGTNRRIRFVKDIVNDPIYLWEGAYDMEILGKSGKSWKYSEIRRDDSYGIFAKDWLMDAREFWLYFLIIPLMWPFLHNKAFRKRAQSFQLLGLSPGRPTYNSSP